MVGVDTRAIDFILPVGIGEQVVAIGIIVAEVGILTR